MKAMGTHEYTIILEPDPEDGGFTVLVPALPGCITEGDTREEAIANAKEAILLYLESLLADGEEIPVDVPNPEVLKVAV
jgi:predicted RNase H-like HicB family nuclease